MNTLNKLIVVLFASSLLGLGLYIWFGSGISLPTRHPPTQFHFSGLSQILLGCSPFTFGTVTLAIALQALEGESRLTQLLIGLGLAMLGLAFILAPKF